MSAHVVLAGGGTGGHLLPMLAVADALRRIDPDVGITCLGTSKGLDTTMVPERGYDLALIPPVPLPRKPSGDLLKLPLRVRTAVKEVRRVFERVGADVLVGFGGYVALPAYLAARKRLPIVIHEGNPLPGLANKVGAKFADVVAVTMDGTPLPNARTVGMPLRTSITSLDRSAMRAEAREHFGLDPYRPTLLVFGGSQGARTLNVAASGAASELFSEGVQVLHLIGGKNTIAVPDSHGGPAYVALNYVDRMDLAYAAADLAVCRSGGVTCAEMTAVGLPGIFVPLPIGNGEQRLNAEPIVAAGGGLLVDDAELTAQRLADLVVPLIIDPDRLETMGKAAAQSGHRDADEVLARIALEEARK